MGTLYKEIMAGRIMSDRRQWWIPYAHIKGCVDRAQVRNVLETAQQRPPNIKTLENFVLGQNGALRLFAALFVHQNVDEVALLLNLFSTIDYHDEMFPISVEYDGPDDIVIESKAARNTIRYEGDMELVERAIQNVCDLAQWRFFPPVFHPNNFYLTLSRITSCHFFTITLMTPRAPISV